MKTYRFFLCLSLIPFWILPASAIDSLTEPDTVIVGQVYNHETPEPYIAPEGIVTWRIQSQDDPSKVFEYRAPIEEWLIPDPDNPGQRIRVGYYFRITISHQASLSTFQLDDSAVPLGVSDETYDHIEITVDGFPATIRGGAEALVVSQENRGIFKKIDLDVTLKSEDSDNDGMPDWWENLYDGLDPNFPDGDGDLDGDLITNLDEFLGGTDPTKDDGVPQPKRMDITGTEAGITGVRIFASDLNTDPDQVTYELKENITAGVLRVAGRDTELTAGENFTQDEVNKGLVQFVHTDTTLNLVRVPLTLSDGDPAHTDADVTMQIRLKRPTLTDGRDADLWLDANHVTEVLYSDTYGGGDGPVGNNDNALGGTVVAAQSAVAAPAVAGNQLSVSDNVTSPDHNFTDAGLTGSGGFVLSFDVIPPPGALNFAAVSLGHNDATRKTAGAAHSTQTALSMLFREDGTFSTLDADGSAAAALVAENLQFTLEPAAGAKYHVELTVRTPSFDQGTQATLSALVDGKPIEVGGEDEYLLAFAWNETGMNFLAWESVGGGSFFDNVRVSTLPRDGDLTPGNWTDRSRSNPGPGVTGDDVVRRDAERDFLVDNSGAEERAFAYGEDILGAADRTVFAVLRPDGAERQQILTTPEFEIAAEADDSSVQSKRLLFESGSRQVFSADPITGSGRLHSVLARSEGEETQLSVDGLIGTVRNPGEITRLPSDPGVVLGGRREGGELNQPFNGPVAEVLSFPGALNFDRICDIDFYLKSKWQGHVLFDASAEPDYSPQTIMSGSSEPHILVGGAGPDVLTAGDADDWLKGGPEADTMTGGDGRNVFVLEGNDIVTDFDPEKDVLLFHHLLDGDTSELQSYVSFTSDGTDTMMGLDRNGDGSGYDDMVITLLGTVLTNADLSGLTAYGALRSGLSTDSVVRPPVTTPSDPPVELHEFTSLMTGRFEGLISFPVEGKNRPVGRISLRLAGPFTDLRGTAGNRRRFSSYINFFGNEVRIRDAFEVDATYRDVFFKRHYAPVNIVDGEILFPATPDFHQEFEIVLGFVEAPSGAILLTGTITDGTGRIFHIDADHRFFDDKNPWTGVPGNFTHLILRDSDGSRPENSRGNGSGAMKIGRTGGVSFLGLLGDGSKFSASSAISRDSRILFFQDLYRTGPRGLIGGELHLRDTGVSDLDGKAHWVKFPDPKEKRYPGGFQHPDLAMIGSRYVRPPRGFRSIVLDDTQNNAEILFADGRPGTMDDRAEKPFRRSYLSTWDRGNRIRYAGAAAESIKLAVGNNGIITGAYAERDTKVKVRLYGAVFQKQNLASGAFLGKNETGLFEISANHRHPDLTSLPGGPGLADPAAPLVSAAAPVQGEAAGKFTGIISDRSGGSPFWSNFSLSANGAFSLSLFVDGKKRVLKGQLAADGSFAGSLDYAVRVNGARVTRTLNVSLQLQKSADGFRLVGTAMEGARNFDLVLDRRGFNRSDPALDFVSKYTFTLSQATAGRITDGSLFPQGHGAGVFEVRKDGSILAVGNLPDGVKFSHTGFVSRDGRWPLLVHPYKAIPERGHLLAEVSFRDLPDISDADGKVAWEKQPFARDKAYPGGFDHEVFLVASRFVPPAKGERGLASIKDQTNNLAVSLSDAGVSPEENFHATWNTANKIIHLSGEREVLRLGFKPGNGYVVGKYVDFVPDPGSGRIVKRVLVLRSVVNQKQQIIGGYFVNEGQGGDVTMVPFDPGG